MSFGLFGQGWYANDHGLGEGEKQVQCWSLETKVPRVGGDSIE